MILYLLKAGERDAAPNCSGAQHKTKGKPPAGSVKNADSRSHGIGKLLAEFPDHLEEFLPIPFQLQGPNPWHLKQLLWGLGHTDTHLC